MATTLKALAAFALRVAAKEVSMPLSEVPVALAKTLLAKLLNEAL